MLHHSLKRKHCFSRVDLSAFWILQCTSTFAIPIAVTNSFLDLNINFIRSYIRHHIIIVKYIFTTTMVKPVADGRFGLESALALKGRQYCFMSAAAWESCCCMLTLRNELSTAESLHMARGHSLSLCVAVCIEKRSMLGCVSICLLSGTLLEQQPTNGRYVRARKFFIVVPSQSDTLVRSLWSYRFLLLPCVTTRTAQRQVMDSSR